MKMTRLNIQIPDHLKAKLDPLRTQGTLRLRSGRRTWAHRNGPDNKKGPMGMVYKPGAMYWINTVSRANRSETTPTHPSRRKRHAF